VRNHRFTRVNYQQKNCQNSLPPGSFPAAGKTNQPIMKIPYQHNELHLLLTHFAAKPKNPV
jgi:hypothetical protein